MFRITCYIMGVLTTINKLPSKPNSMYVFRTSFTVGYCFIYSFLSGCTLIQASVITVSSNNIMHKWSLMDNEGNSRLVLKRTYKFQGGL